MHNVQVYGTRMVPGKKIFYQAAKDSLHQDKLKWPSGSGKDFDVFSLFRNYLPLEMGMVLHVNKNLNPLHWRILCAKIGCR